MSQSTCPHCGLPISGPVPLEAKTICCPHCGKTTVVSRPSLSPPKDSKLHIPPAVPPKKLSATDVAAVARDVIRGVEEVIIGKHEQVTLAVAVLLAEGHLLVEDVPGVAKTMLARAVAQSAGCAFKRIQCTPDLRPSDVLGDACVDPESGKMDFRFGPLFAQFVLVDEINRASPHTQAALLEAMGETSVTSGRVTYKMPRPFMVIATQNPVDQEGTFALPEAQKDRFLIRLRLGYPSLADERAMCEHFQLGHPIETLKPATTPDRMVKCQEAVREIRLGTEVCDYILALVRATREHPAVLLGASPRASLGLFRLAQAMAAIKGHDAVSLAHVQALAEAVLAHRLIVKEDHQDRYPDGGSLIKEIIAGSKPL
jgi:MoxR-like ATPase